MSLYLTRIPILQLVTAASRPISAHLRGETGSAFPTPSVRRLKFSQPFLVHGVPAPSPSWGPSSALTAVWHGPAGTGQPRTGHKTPGALPQVPNGEEGSLPSACWLHSCQYSPVCCWPPSLQRQTADFQLIEPQDTRSTYTNVLYTQYT